MGCVAYHEGFSFDVGRKWIARHKRIREYPVFGSFSGKGDMLAKYCAMDGRTDSKIALTLG